MDETLRLKAIIAGIGMLLLVIFVVWAIRRSGRTKPGDDHSGTGTNVGGDGGGSAG
ncbi:MAG: hypothetical protein AAFT19_11805 [Pseudomonadota bacterium]